MQTPTTLLERERELAELGGALAGAREGRGRVVLIEAPAGLGKTSLLRAAADAAAGGGLRLPARAGERPRARLRLRLRAAAARARRREASAPERERLFDGAAGLARPTVRAGRRRAAGAAVSGQRVLDAARPLLAGQQRRRRAAGGARRRRPALGRRRVAAAPPLPGPAPGRPAARGRRDDAPAARATSASSPAWPARPRPRSLRPGPLSTEATATLCARRLGPEVAPEFAHGVPGGDGRQPVLSRGAAARGPRAQGFPTDAGGALRAQRIGPAAVARAVLLRLSGKPPAADGARARRRGAR